MQLEILNRFAQDITCGAMKISRNSALKISKHSTVKLNHRLLRKLYTQAKKYYGFTIVLL